MAIIGYTGKNSDSGPSPRIWSRFKILESMEDRNIGTELFEDFRTFCGSVTTKVGSYRSSGMSFESYEESGGSIVQLPTEVNGVIRIATDATDNDIFTGEALIQIRTAGASGTLVAVASGNIVPAATRVAVPVFQITASATIDTTAAQVVGVGADWSAASSSNSARLDIMVVEIY